MSAEARIEVGTPPPPASETGTGSLTLAVENMHCGGCLRSVERAALKLPGVIEARANLTAKRLRVLFDPVRCAEADIVAALERAGFHAAPLRSGGEGIERARDAALLRRAAVAGFAAANIMLLSISVWAGVAGDMDAPVQTLFHWLSALIALPTVVYAGQPFFGSALAALKGRRLNMDVPISLAILLATGMSLVQTGRGSEQVYFDAAVTLLFFLLIGRWLDERLRLHARREAHNLLSLQGGLATVIDADGARRQVPAQALLPGERVLVAAGERVPADGVLLSEAANIDQSLITGESTPCLIRRGTTVYAGTLNFASAIEIAVTAADEATLLAEIGRLMASAEEGRGRYRRLADRAASVYAPAVHGAGALTMLLWLALGAGWEQALTHAIAVLIITCPCALALAVPAVQVAAAGRLLRRGVILKTADGLERLAEIDTVAFDKTGTLTLGRPRLIDDGALDVVALRAAARLAAASRHPYAKALAAAAEKRWGGLAVARDCEEVAGLGLRRMTGGGEERLGSAAWVDAGTDDDGATVWYRAPAGTPVAFRVGDAVRADAGEVMAALAARGYKLVLLSGDGDRAVAEAAREAGIAHWRARLRPVDKIRWLEARRDEGRKVLMVGDGLNDAPALAAAHVSMSPATAADISQRTADLIFQGDRLQPVAEAIGTARRARRLVLQNFGLALAYNVVCVPLAMAGFVTPLVAALAMSTSSILVTVNAARLAVREARP